MALRLAVGEEFLLHGPELGPLAEACRHAAPEQVGFLQVEARVEVRHLQHVLLVHHHAVGLGHDLQQLLGCALHASGIVVAQDVLAHHAAFGHAGTDDAAGGHQGEVVLHAQLLQQHAHGGAFHIEAAHGVAGAQQLLDGGVLLECGDVVNVQRMPTRWVDGTGAKHQHITFGHFPLSSGEGRGEGHSSPLLGRGAGGEGHHLHRIPNMPQAALAEDIELVQAEVLAFQQAELHHGKALGRAEQRAVVRYRPVRDHDAAHMDAELVRHADEFFRVAHHGLRHLVQVAAAGLLTWFSASISTTAFAQSIDLFRRKPHGLAQFAHGTPPLEGGVGGHLRGVEPGASRGTRSVVVLIENVLEHLVAVLPAEVDVEVGRLFAGGADEAFEVEVELDGVHVGDAEAIGHQAVGAAAAPHVEEAAVLRVAHDVLIDEEVADEAHALDHVQLVFHAREHLGRGVRVAAVQPFQRVAVQPFAVLGGVFSKNLAGLVAAVEGDVALLQQLFGVAQQFREIAIAMAYFFFTAEAVGGIGELFGGQQTDQRVARHGAQQAVAIEVPRAWTSVVAEGDGQQGHQILRPLGPWAEGQARKLSGFDTDAFVGMQRARRRAEGQDEEGFITRAQRCCPEHRRGIRQRLAIQQVRAKQFVQLLVAVVVLGQADIEQPRP